MDDSRFGPPAALPEPDPTEPSTSGVEAPEGAMPTDYVPTGWDDFRLITNDKRERQELELDILARRAVEGFTHEREVRNYRRRRGIAITVLVIVAMTIWIPALLSFNNFSVASAGLSSAVTAVITGATWNLVVGHRPSLNLTQLPQNAAKHPAFGEGNNDQTPRRFN